MRTLVQLTVAAFALVVLTSHSAVPAADAKPLTEEQKIQALIAHVRGLGDGAVMIRNGSEHSAKDAADHMAAKRKRAGDKVKTATDFITLCAAKSSASGKPYQIKFKDGRQVTSEAYLAEQLGKMAAAK